MGKLTDLQNIGKKLEEQLNAVGIFTPEQLKDEGSRSAWAKIKKNDPSACYMRLCSLEGAIRGVKWHGLDAETKAELKDFYNEHK